MKTLLKYLPLHRLRFWVESVLFPLAFSLLLKGCGLYESPKTTPVIEAPKVIYRPISIALLIDRSGSGVNHLIPVIPLGQIISRPMQTLRVSGGQLTVSIIDGSPDSQILCSCRVEPPSWPLAPIKPARNDFASALAYKKALSKYKRQDLSVYEAQIKKIVEDIDARVRRFNTCLDRMDAIPADSSGTDIVLAIKLIQVAHYQAPIGVESCHTILLSDGVSNVTTSKLDASSIDSTNYWCAYCTHAASKKKWYKQLKVRAVSDLDVAFDIIYSQSQIK